MQDLIRCRSNPLFKRFLIVSLCVLSWLAVDVSVLLFEESVYLRDSMPRLRLLRLLTAYLLPVFGIVNLWLLAKFAEQAPSKAHLAESVGGLVFVAGAAGFDLAVTLALSPDLSDEGNPYVRVLLDTGHSLGFVYGHMLLTQGLFVGLFCGVWLGFLRHRAVLVHDIAAAHPQGWIEFLKAATGGGHLTRRQWLFPLNAAEVPLLYHSVWATAVPVVLGISVFRWYAGLEWLGVVEVSTWMRHAVIFIAVTGALGLYFVHLWGQWQLAERA